MDWNLLRVLVTCLFFSALCGLSGYVVFRCQPIRIESEDWSLWFAPVDIKLLDADAQYRYRQQLATDSTDFAFAPDLDIDVELWPNGSLPLGPIIYAGYDSTIFEVADNPQILIKYQTDCDEVELRGIHPLLRDFWYGHAAYRIGIAPQPLYLSPPSLLYKNASKVSNIKSTDEDIDWCIGRSGSVRFMVMERRGAAITLFRFAQAFYRGGRLPFSVAMQTGIRLIEQLRDLHQTARVVHGDIHPNNILVEGQGDVIEKILLIDFGRSRANIPARSKRPIYNLGQWSDPALSHWQILGYEWSARDDVFNALRTIACLMNDNDYNIHELKLKDLRGPVALINWRQFGFIFATPGQHDIIHRLPMISTAHKQQIRASLHRILGSVRSLEDVDNVPNYELIIGELRNCLRLAPIYS